DVTEQRARDAEEQREQLRLIFDHTAQIALALYDAETMSLLMASPRYLEGAARAHSAKTRDLIGRKLPDLDWFVSGDAAAELWDEVLRSRATLRRPEVHIQLDPQDPETVWDWFLRPIMDTEQPDRVRYMLVSAVEITEQAQARAEIERLDHLKDEFLALASHELRTPLTTLIGQAQRLIRLLSHGADIPDRDERIVRMGDIFNSQLKRLNQLVGDLLDVGRLESGRLTLHKERVNLAELLERTIEDARMLSAEHTIRLHLPESGGPLLVEADTMRLTQVVLNLVQNAITYAPQSKRIDVRLSRGPSTLRIAVQDYGAGIAPEERTAIFTRFYQVVRPDRPTRAGLGLGLFICKQIVEQHGGTISVDSVVGQGATFVVELPLAEGGG
ncbi:MAG TPA: ATP-binding protein, partial [Roseiflexaceae bacterium]